MRRFLFIFILIPFSFVGQHLLPIMHDTAYVNHELILNGVGNYSSSSIRIDLGKKLLYGGEIGQDLIDASALNHRSINRFGIYINSEVEYRNRQANCFKNPKFGFLLKAGAYSYLDVLYPKGMYDLAFYGNSNFGGQEIDLSGLRASAFLFEKIGFGLIHKQSNSSVSLNLVNLTNYASINISDASLFQSNDFDSLNLNLTGSGYLMNSPAFFSGIGASIDADFRIPVLTPKEDTILFQFKLSNFGFAHLINEVSRYDMNKEVPYTGIDINSTLDGQNILNSGFSVLDSLEIQQNSVKRTVFLPGYIQMSKLINESSDRSIQEFYGLRMFFSSAYTPLVFAGLNFKLGKKINLGGSLNYGGFSSFSGGLYTSFHHKKIAIGMSTENISGFFINSARGESIIFRFRCAF